MIETEYIETKRIISHTAIDAVDRDDLVAAVLATTGDFRGVLWDFRLAEFAVSLHIVHSPSYETLYAEFNRAWQTKRTAYLVGSQLHRLMIQTFAEEGEFTFPWQIFSVDEDAEAWLLEL